MYFHFLKSLAIVKKRIILYVDNFRMYFPTSC